MRRFDILRACFYLVAVVVLIMMLETLIALTACTWLVAVAHQAPLGACQDMAATIKEIMAELLTAVLALLVASRPNPPGSGSSSGENRDGEKDL